MTRNLGLMMVTAAMAAGCGSNGADVERFLQASAKATCAWEYKCCTDREILLTDGTKYKNEEECYPYKYLALVDQLYLERLAAGEGRIRVDNTKADACLKQLEGKLCNPMPGMPAPVVDPTAIDPCTEVLIGATGIGGSCIYRDECVKGSHCVVDASTVGRGVCVPYQQEGDICNDDSDCDPKVKNLYCAKKDFTCHVRGQLGAACAFSYENSSSASAKLPMLLECDATKYLYCDPIVSTCLSLPGDGQDCLDPLPPGVTSTCSTDPRLKLVCSTSGTTSTCRAPGGLGADCRTRACQATLICDSSSRTCVEAPDLGAPCPNFVCRTPYFCNNNLATPACDQPASFGEACDVSPNFTPCGSDLYCDSTVLNRTCKYLLSDGQTCTSSLQCQSSSCQFDAATSRQICQTGVIGGVQCIGR